MRNLIELPSPPSLKRWAKLALYRLCDAARLFLGMDLEEDGSVRVHGTDERRPTVGMIAPFGLIAHHIQVLRSDSASVLRFYEVYHQSCVNMGRKAASFDGQVQAFVRAMDAVPLPRPRLAAVG